MAVAFGEMLAEERIVVYFEALEPYPVEVVEVALGRCLTDSKFFPRISEIVDRLPLPDVPDVGEGLWLAREAAAHYLPGEPPPPVPDVVRDTIRAIGGFRLFAHLPAEEQWQRFSAAYPEVTRARPHGRTFALPPLPSHVTQLAAQSADREQVDRGDLARRRTTTMRVEPLVSPLTRVPVAQRPEPTPAAARPAKPVETEAERQHRIEKQREKLRAQAHQLGCAQPATAHGTGQRSSIR